MERQRGSKVHGRGSRVWLPPKRAPAGSGRIPASSAPAVGGGPEAAAASFPTDHLQNDAGIEASAAPGSVDAVDAMLDKSTPGTTADLVCRLPTILNAMNAIENQLLVSVTGITRLVNIDIPAMRNALNGLENNILLLRMMAEQAAAGDRRREHIDLLHRRAVVARTHQPAKAFPIEPVRPHALAETLRDLERRAPKNFATWIQLLDESKMDYRGRSAADLSVGWHREAQLFGDFLTVHAVGRVLDVGVGPLPVPSYLDGIPLDRLAGLDPIEPFEPHPFAFANSVAETIPWPDASFETVVTATSLDHTYLLDAALQEVARVLAPGGAFLVWTTLLPESPVYHPYGDAFQPVDDHHLFHPGENWFPALMSRWFRLRERIEVASNNVFMAFEKT